MNDWTDRALVLTLLCAALMAMVITGAIVWDLLNGGPGVCSR